MQIKKTLTLSLALVFLLAGTSFSFAQKLGHVNTQKIMTQLPAKQKTEQKVQKFAQKLQREIKEMRSEYQKKATQFQQNEANMTETERQSEMEKLTNLQQRISQAQQKAQQDLQNQEQELLQPIIKKVENAVNKVAKENDFTYVFDASTGTLLYKGGGEDLTPLVKKELGMTGKKEKEE